MPTDNDEASDHSKPATKAYLPLLIGALLIPLGRYVPLPGVDPDALHELLGTRIPLAGLVGSTIPTLATIYLFVLGIGRKVGRTALVIYLLLAAVQGLGMATWLESLNGMHGGHYFSIDVVLEPGWGFRLLLMLGWTAGAGLVWWVASFIDRRTDVQGVLFLLLVHTVLAYVEYGTTTGANYANATTPSWALVEYLFMPSWLLFVAILMYRKPRQRWPLRLWRWELRSPLDVLSLVAVATIPKTTFAVFVPDENPWLQYLGIAMGLVIGVQIALLWERTAEEGARSWKLLFGTTLVFGLLSAALALGFVQEGGLERMMIPPPLFGDRAFTLVLRAEDHFEPSDGDAMCDRIHSLGAEAEVLQRSAQQLTLRVEAAIDSEHVLAAIAVPSFYLTAVLDLRVHGDGRAAQLQGFPLGDTEPVVSCSDAERFSGTDGDCRYRVSVPDDDNHCSFYCLSPEPTLMAQDVAEAMVSYDTYANTPVVSINLTPAGAARFGEFTGAHVGEALAIVVNERVLSAPTIQTAIVGGHVQITLGSGRSYNEMLSEAQILAANLDPAGRVMTQWTLVSVE